MIDRYHNMASELGFELGNQISELLQLSEVSKKSPVVIYSGRFQPFHKGHYQVYKHLVDKFGKDNVYIATSDKIELPKSPFDFSDKKKIITTIFPDIPNKNVVKVKNPYAPTEILNNFSENTPYVTIVGKSDADRLSHSKYFKPFSGDMNSGYKDAGYYMIAPDRPIGVGGEQISGTQVRKTFSDPKTSSAEKQKLFKELFGTYNDNIFKLVTTKIEQSQSPIKTTTNIPDKIKNPKTGNVIKVKSALTYSKDEPVRRAAEKLVHHEHILVEGGAYGHMKHPYEDVDLTFNQMKDIIKRSFSGDLNKESDVTEKTDGQNLSFTLKNGQLFFARNTGHLKNAGQNAMTVDQLKEKFANRGELTDAFSTAADDIISAFKNLPPEQLDSIFQNGKSFMSMEIINPKTRNVIPYDKPILVFHGTTEHDEAGNPIGRNYESGKIISDALRKLGAQQQKTYGLQGQQVISFNSFDDKESQKKLTQYIQNIDREASSQGLTPNSTLQDYFDIKWKRKLKHIDAHAKLGLTDEDIDKLVARWSRNDKNSGSIKNFSNPKIRKFISNMEKMNDAGGSHLEDIRNQIAEPIEHTFVQVASDVINNATNLFVANNPLVGQKMQQKVEKVIERIRTSPDSSKSLNKLNILMKKLENAGGIKGIKPTEGVVFVYNGKPYKFTGAFGPTNRILGLLGFEAKRDDDHSIPNSIVDKSTINTKAAKPKKTQSKPKTTRVQTSGKFKKTKSQVLNKKILNPVTRKNILVRTALGYEKTHPAHKAAVRQFHLTDI
jgi:hypothetical protein